MENKNQVINQLIASLSGEQLEELNRLLANSVSAPKQVITEIPDNDTQAMFNRVLEQQWFIDAVDAYKASGWSAYGFIDVTKQPKDYLETNDYFAFTSALVGDCHVCKALNNAVCELIGIDSTPAYPVADTVSNVVTWALENLGSGIAWTGKKIYEAGNWVEDNAPDAGNYAGKPIRWTSDMIESLKVKVQEVKADAEVAVKAAQDAIDNRIK